MCKQPTTPRLNLPILSVLLRPLPFLPSTHHPLLITNNNHHVPPICCWTNIKWAISAKYVWRDITFSWGGELEAESVLGLSQQMLSGGVACTHRPPSLSSHSYSCPSAPSGLHPASSLYPALYPPLSPPLCPTLALLSPLVVVHRYTHTALLCKHCIETEREGKAVMLELPLKQRSSVSNKVINSDYMTPLFIISAWRLIAS